VIRQLEGEQAAYFRWLPVYYPYLLKEQPETFVVQFGGGISTAVALQAGSRQVTVAEGNPALLQAFRTQKVLRDFTGDVLHNPRVRVIDHEGRLYLGRTDRRYDVIDLSLADSVGLSSPRGFAVVEKFSYTREAFVSYMRALKPDGILSVTLWNKEEPPKSVLKLYVTLVAAAREAQGRVVNADARTLANSFFAVSSYLSTTTVLYKQGASRPKSSSGCASTPTCSLSTPSTRPTWRWTRPAQSNR
jgi:spermidine synthase